MADDLDVLPAQSTMLVVELVVSDIQSGRGDEPVIPQIVLVKIDKPDAPDPLDDKSIQLPDQGLPEGLVLPV